MSKNKEKIDKQLIFMVQPSLLAKFQEACEKNYKSVSDALRDFMVKYVKENEGNETK